MSLHATEVFLILFHSEEGHKHPYSKGHVKSARGWLIENGSIDCYEVVDYVGDWQTEKFKKINKNVSNPDLPLSKPDCI